MLSSRGNTDVSTVTHCRLNGGGVGDDDDNDDHVPSEKGERISRGLIVSDGA